MRPVQIAPTANSDIAQLSQGLPRLTVALDALKELQLTPAQVKQLEALAASQTGNAASATQSHAGDRGNALLSAEEMKRAILAFGPAHERRMERYWRDTALATGGVFAEAIIREELAKELCKAFESYCAKSSERGE